MRFMGNKSKINSIDSFEYTESFCMRHLILETDEEYIEISSKGLNDLKLCNTLSEVFDTLNDNHFADIVLLLPKPSNLTDEED